MAPRVSPLVIISLAIGYIAWGTVQTLSLKWADGLYAPDRFTALQPLSSDDGSSVVVTPELLYSFAHPFTQAFFMFCAEALCLVVFGLMLLYKRYFHMVFKGEGAPRTLVRGEDVSLPCNPGVWLLTSGADFIASIMQNVGMMLTYASVYQMLRGATVFWIAMISYVWLGRRFTKVELWGMGFVVLGLTLVGLSSILRLRASSSPPGTAGAHEYQMIGNILVVSAQILHAYQGVCQERLFSLYRIPPLQMVGIEGVYGIGMSLTLLALLQLIPTASWGHNLGIVREAVHLGSGTSAGSELNTRATTTVAADYRNVMWLKTRGGTARVPYGDMVLAFDQISQSTPCLISTLTYIAAGVFYNDCQLAIIKHLSAAATVMMGSLRNVSVWAVCLMLPTVFHETFNIVQFIGFIFLVLGNVLFQRVWFSHFDQLLPAAMVERCPLLFKDFPPAVTADVVIEADSPASDKINSDSSVATQG